jgi:hypothetical protein
VGNLICNLTRTRFDELIVPIVRKTNTGLCGRRWAMPDWAKTPSMP